MSIALWVCVLPKLKQSRPLWSCLPKLVPFTCKALSDYVKVDTHVIPLTLHPDDIALYCWVKALLQAFYHHQKSISTFQHSAVSKTVVWQILSVNIFSREKSISSTVNDVSPLYAVPYLSRNSPWNLVSLSQTSPIADSDGRKVVRKWNVPSTCTMGQFFVMDSLSISGFF